MAHRTDERTELMSERRSNMEKRDFSRPWKWIGDFRLGGIYSVWQRYDSNFRRRYAITKGVPPADDDEGEIGPKWLVIERFCKKFPHANAKFYWISWDPRDPDSIHCW